MTSPSSDGPPSVPPPLEEWIEASRHGSPQALGLLLEACRQYLLAIANHELDAELRAKVGASDLVQETCLKAQEKFHQFGGSTEAELLAWLRTILLRCLANIKRRYQQTAMRKLVREIPLESASSLVAERSSRKDRQDLSSSQVIAGEELHCLEEALSQLPAHYRQVILWRNWDRCTFAEIGKRLGRSTEAARKLWVRAIEQLQDIVKPPESA